MKSNRITFKSFAASIIAVGVIEAVFGFFGQQLIPEPLVRTGAARLLDALFLCGILAVQFSLSLSSPCRPGLLKKIRIAVFICFLMAFAAVLYRYAGINLPFGVSRHFRGSSVFKMDLFVVSCILSPLAEELFFRGVVFRYFRRFSFVTALIISTLFFSLFHCTSTGLPLLPLVGGFLLAIVYDREKTLASPVLVHSLGNFLLVFVLEA